MPVNTIGMRIVVGFFIAGSLWGVSQVRINWNTEGINKNLSKVECVKEDVNEHQLRFEKYMSRIDQYIENDRDNTKRQDQERGELKKLVSGQYVQLEKLAYVVNELEKKL